MKYALQFGIVLPLILSAQISADSENGDLCSQRMACPTACDVFLAAPCYSFSVTGAALLLQPTGGNLHYAAEAFPLPLYSPNWKIHKISPDYHFGFEVGIESIFSCSNTNLMLNWEHFNSKDTASKTVDPSDMIGPFFEIGPDASAYKQAHGKSTCDFDLVNLDYGIFLNLGKRLKTNLFSGVSYGYIKQTLFSRFASLDETVVRTIKVPSTFRGAGPELGLDLSYRIADGFHFTGGGIVSLLVGTQKNHTNFTAISPGLAAIGAPSPNDQKTQVRSNTQVVPGIQGNLGLSYSATFCDCYMLKIRGGVRSSGLHRCRPIGRYRK